MYEVLIVIIAVLLLVVKGREAFFGDGMHVGGNDWINFDVHGEGYEVYATTPFTCPEDKPDLNAGFCYPNCKPGYHGAVTMCVKDTYTLPAGTIMGLMPCPNGWSNDGLFCRAPISNDCSWKDLFGTCWGKLGGGQSEPRGFVCPGPDPRGWDHTDKIDGLCYAKCPPGQGHLPGAPYLCAKDPGGALTYDRGAGKPPNLIRFFGRYGFL